MINYNIMVLEHVVLISVYESLYDGSKFLQAFSVLNFSYVIHR